MIFTSHLVLPPPRTQMRYTDFNHPKFVEAETIGGSQPPTTATYHGLLRFFLLNFLFVISLIFELFVNQRIFHNTFLSIPSKIKHQISQTTKSNQTTKIQSFFQQLCYSPAIRTGSTTTPTTTTPTFTTSSCGLTCPLTRTPTTP